MSAVTTEEKVYLSSGSPWLFGDCKYEPAGKSGTLDRLDGYIVVWGAKDPSFNGIYYGNSVGAGHIYQGPYMKPYMMRGHCLKFTPKKGIKIIPIVEKYKEVNWNSGWKKDPNWSNSPRNDDKIANMRWDLIQTAKKKVSNGEKITFIAQKAKMSRWNKSAEIAITIDPNTDDDNVPEYDEFENDDDYQLATKKKDLKKHYQRLLKHESFTYRYTYLCKENDLNKLVHYRKGAEDTAQYAFICNFAFHETLYPHLAANLPKDYVYKSKAYVNNKLLAIDEHFNAGAASILVNLVCSYLHVSEFCIHKSLIHIFCESEGKYEAYFSHYFVCEECEARVPIPPNDSDINEQLMFVSRVKRSFGLERNMRHPPTQHLHSFKLRKWMFDQRFGGMTHVCCEDIDIYNTDNVPQMNDSHKIGTISDEEEVHVYFQIEVESNDPNTARAFYLAGLRTKDNVIGFCVVAEHGSSYWGGISTQFMSLKLTRDEAEDFILKNNMIETEDETKKEDAINAILCRANYLYRI